MWRPSNAHLRTITIIHCPSLSLNDRVHILSDGARFLKKLRNLKHDEIPLIWSLEKPPGTSNHMFDCPSQRDSRQPGFRKSSLPCGTVNRLHVQCVHTVGERVPHMMQDALLFQRVYRSSQTQALSSSWKVPTTMTMVFVHQTHAFIIPGLLHLLLTLVRMTTELTLTSSLTRYFAGKVFHSTFIMVQGRIRMKQWMLLSPLLQRCIHLASLMSTEIAQAIPMFSFL